MMGREPRAKKRKFLDAKRKKSRRGRTPWGIRPRRLTRQPAPRPTPGCPLS